MFILNRRKLLQAAGLGAVSLALPKAVMAATSSSVFTSDEAGALVDSTIIMGEASAVVVDAQLTAGNAQALADMIAATGRSLQSVIITHYHPDHLLGLPILLDRFPGTVAYAHPDVQAFIARVAQPMFDGITASAPAGFFADRVVIPEALSADHIMLEGERIEVLPPMLGDTELITPVYVPALDTLITSDVACIDTHLWLEESGTPEGIAAWRDSVATLRAVNASVIIPGHPKPGSPNKAAVFDATLASLDAWEGAVAAASDAQSLRAEMANRAGDLGFAMGLDTNIKMIYP